ncbi:DVU_1553 family AMP-dependent CoA ligase [Acetobacterium sp. KB-1]|jgi:phenylacetate-coenzyme A ligase PaaK-like adenylate-forming protein|uniref:DVU_1553 family AMP-dependent CoA ligase n=1 Tax=Acetobacterium sp. KB-1 TaxID=2184575 RepID=UPI000DBECD73|nr:AMP-binding protein [Acetobacterium sp. KB-1]AWW25238.1 phenylacetate--CoA ligase family protein [Acetobacterium sp. KB-1]
MKKNKTPMEDWIVKRTGLTSANQKSLSTYQFKKLVEVFEYAKANGAFYQKQFVDQDLREIKSWDDFKLLPFTTGADIKKNPFSFLCIPQQQVDRIVTLNTSGTSGKKKRLFFTEEDLLKTVDFFDYGMRSLTDSSDRVLVLLPGQAYGTIGDLLKKALARSNTTCIVFGLLTDLDAVAQVILRNRINCIVGIPIQVLYLSRSKAECFKQIEKVLLSTDYVPKSMVAELSHKFRCRVFNHYGMTEMGYGGGVECEALNGYHLREGDLYLEIIDPDSGSPIEDGKYGEIVFTSLNRIAMPLIRYRTGDIGAFSTDLCPCGTFLRTLKKVAGRYANRIRLDHDNYIDLSTFEESLLGDENILDYQVLIKNNSVLSIMVNFYNQNRLDQKISRVKEILVAHLSVNKKDNVRIEVEQGNLCKPDQMVNSMVKRRIIDLRKEECNG